MSQVASPEVPSGSGLSVRQAINAVMAALMSNNSGPTEPANPIPFQLWGDTAANDLKIRNASNTAWVLLSDFIGALEYDRAQSLTPSKQGQARANIGAGTFQWNWVINGDFTVNQRGGVKKPANGVYGYDRWKGHANGIEQVVEALPAGEYTLTWTGGGTGAFGDVTGASPIKATVSGGNTSIVVPEVATKVSLVAGDATAETDPFSSRHPQQELALCQRYYEKNQSPLHALFPWGSATQVLRFSYGFRTSKRATPTVSLSKISGAGTLAVLDPGIDGFVTAGTGVAQDTASYNWSADAEL